MMLSSPHVVLTPKLLDGLYLEAMVLTDEARSYFDVEGQQDQLLLDAEGKLGFACESLRVTTKLMQVVSWLLVQKSAQTGETDQASAPPRRLASFYSLDDSSADLALLPERALGILLATNDLYDRVRRLDDQLERGGMIESPVLQLIGRLEAML
jgi:regulator of CtrA degradation